MNVFSWFLINFQDGDFGHLQEEHHNRGHYQALLQMTVGTFWDTTNHHIQSVQLVPQYILVKPLVTARH
jgi:hypothetical protein